MSEDLFRWCGFKSEAETKQVEKPVDTRSKVVLTDKFKAAGEARSKIKIQPNTDVLPVFNIQTNPAWFKKHTVHNSVIHENTSSNAVSSLNTDVNTKEIPAPVEEEKIHDATRSEDVFNGVNNPISIRFTLDERIKYEACKQRIKAVNNSISPRELTIQAIKQM